VSSLSLGHALAATTLVTTLLAGVAALAQPAHDSTRETARGLADQAMTKYRAEDWQGALELFVTADKLLHSPALVLYAARCHRRLGRLLQARDLYRRIVREPIEEPRNPAFDAARADAGADLAGLELRIPKVTLRLERLPRGTRIHLDDRVVSARELSDGIALDPGHHVARATLDGREVARRSFEAIEGGEQHVVLSAAPNHEPEPADDAALRWVPGAVVLAGGVAGLVAGVVTRVLALEAFDAVTSRCQGDHCLPSDEDNVERAETLETVSSVCFAVGGAAAAAGIVLLVVRPGSDGATKVSLNVAPTWLRLRTTF
jgi:hypothetical protein